MRHPDHLTSNVRTLEQLDAVLALARDWQAHRTVEALDYRQPRDLVLVALEADLVSPLDAEGLHQLRAMIAALPSNVFRDAGPHPYLTWEARQRPDDEPLGF